MIASFYEITKEKDNTGEHLNKNIRIFKIRLSCNQLLMIRDSPAGAFRRQNVDPIAIFIIFRGTICVLSDWIFCSPPKTALRSTLQS